MFLLLVGALILYVLWDVHYFVRCFTTLGWGKYFQKRIKITDQTTIYGLCTSNDVDIFLRHMNNARYFRELDFARYHFYVRTGIYTEIKAVGGAVVQGATSIRYRKAIPIFTPFKIVTKLVWWDEKAIYLEQQFVSVGDNFVRAIALSKQSLTKVNVMDLMKKFDYDRPECPQELKLWLQSIEVSSDKLRKVK